MQAISKPSLEIPINSIAYHNQIGHISYSLLFPYNHSTLKLATNSQYPLRPYLPHLYHDCSELIITNNWSMQNSVCKRIAKSFELQRYVPEYQVYELCINWQSEIPIPPTIFYLSEVFIYPYTLHQLPSPIKNELHPHHICNELHPHHSICIDSQTILDHENTTFLHKTSKSQFGSFGALEHSKPDAVSDVLDYDKMLFRKSTHDLKARNRLIVKHH